MLAVQNIIDLRDVHPFVKWAGGKGQLLPELDKMMPSQFNRYFEPFLGGGAMFLHLTSKGMRFNSYLSDTNSELITAYRAVKDNVKKLYDVFKHMKRNTRNIHPIARNNENTIFN